ncbi:hypothetical protein BURKHO8Y_480125 [Burkholderia sp. 8Y]|nr:hypothetical protein BURKHO8Y_480125 [Burkholderia sp. 8Y]
MSCSAHESSSAGLCPNHYHDVFLLSCYYGELVARGAPANAAARVIPSRCGDGAPVFLYATPKFV